MLGAGAKGEVGFPEMVIFTGCLSASNKHGLMLRNDGYRKADLSPRVMGGVGGRPGAQCPWARSDGGGPDHPTAIGFVPLVPGATERL